MTGTDQGDTKQVGTIQGASWHSTGTSEYVPNARVRDIVAELNEEDCGLLREHVSAVQTEALVKLEVILDPEALSQLLQDLRAAHAAKEKAIKAKS